MLVDKGATRRVAQADARREVSRGGRDMVAALLATDCDNPDLEILEFRRRYQERQTPPASLFAGVESGLRALHAQGFRFAICSNKPQNLCDKVLAELDLAAFFDVVVGGQPGLQPKPAPDLMHMVLQKLNVTVDDCIFVGDSEIDHALAAGVDMRFMLVNYGYADSDTDFAGTARFDDFDQLVAALARLPTRPKTARDENRQANVQ
jgi:phosphoglycolate phosphatase